MKVLLIICLFIQGLSFSQFVATGSYKSQIIFTPSNYYTKTVIARNSNDTYDYYISHNRLNPMVYSLNLRSFGKKYFEDEKAAIGYSLEIGLQHFTSSAILQYNYSSTTYYDSIVNELDGYRYKTHYSTVLFNHFLDFNFPINDKMKFMTSLGIGITAIMRAKNANVPNSAMIDTDFPVAANIIIEPQLIEKYDRFDVGYFLTFHLYSLALYNWKDNDIEYGDTRLKLADLRFSGLGIRFIPHLKTKNGNSDTDF